MNTQCADKASLTSDNDRRYYLERAEAELGLAQQANHPGAVRAHYQMAERYLDQVYGTPDENTA